MLVVFSFSGVYVFLSARCVIASAIYSSLSCTTIVEPLSALLIIMVGFVVSSFRAFLSFLVRLSVVFCLCLCSSTISSLILWRNVSSLPLSVSLSWLNMKCFFGLNGSLWVLCFGVLLCSSNWSIILCMNSLMSLCICNIFSFFGLGIYKV